MINEGLKTVILAGGKGTRMKSESPKVLVKACGRELLAFVIDSVIKSGCKPSDITVVIGYKGDMVKERFSDAGVNFVIQAEQKGTGHAVMMTEKNLKGQDGDVLVLCGDCPLITPKTIMALYSEHRDSGSEATVLSAELEDPSGYGRIVRREDGSVDAIVEQKDAGSDILAIKEVNSGIYIFKNKSLFDALGRIGSDNSQNEYYLTDTVSIIRKNGGRVAALRVIDPSEIMGVNNIEQLEGLEAIINNKKIL